MVMGEPVATNRLDVWRDLIRENFVALELMKTAPWSRARPRVHHLRTSSGQEVDVVLENRKRELVGVEVKAASTIAESDFRGLKVLRELVGGRLKCGVVLYAGQAALPFGPGLWAMPIQSLWATRSARPGLT